MSKAIAFVTIAGFLYGCSSTPEKKPEPKMATEASRPAPPVAKVEAKPVAKPVAQPRIAPDPLNDPNSPLAKRSIYYEFDKSDIQEQYKSLIQAHAGYLSGHRAARVKIEGNCDERGSREYNLALGQRRADSAKEALKLLGAADAQIETVSWGEEKPKDPGHNEAAWTQNRRSDIVYDKSR